jgi:UDP-glucose 4-epimerase
VRLFVTGAFGYLGLALLRRFAPRHEILAFGHPARSAAARAAVPDGVTAVEGDILDVAPAIAEHRPEAIIHLAGGGGPRRVEEDPTRAVRTNVLGTARLAAAAQQAGAARLLFASTIQVYGTHRNWGKPYREVDPTAADDLYGAVKEAAEQIVLAAGGTVLRLANLYGAGSGVDMGLGGAVEKFARAAVAGGEITLYGTGSQRIDYVHVDDVADAIEALLAAPSMPPILNLGGGAPITVGELASACLSGAHKLGQTPRIVVREPPPGPPKIWPDRSLAIGLAGNLLGWRPKVRLQTGIDALCAMMSRSTAA